MNDSPVLWTPADSRQERRQGHGLSRRRRFAPPLSPHSRRALRYRAHPARRGGGLLACTDQGGQFVLYRGPVLAVVLVAVSLGLSNFAASIGIGISGVDARTRWRVGVTFGLFEAGMPVIGLLLGRSLAGALGSATRWLGAALLIATGAYAVIQSVRSRGETSDQHQDVTGQRLGRLVVTGAALSVDNLAVGFALGAYHVSVAIAAVIIGAVSVALSLLGLELGNRVGAKTGANGEIVGGAVLIGVGIAVAAGAL